MAKLGSGGGALLCRAELLVDLLGEGRVRDVEDRRPAAKPTLEEMTQQIGQQLYVDKYRALFDELRKASTIDIPDATLAQQVDQQFGPAQ